jgi:hypothetical protein
MMLILLIVIVACVCANPLPQGLNIDPHSITLSGGSAGGAMANQMHIAYSSLFSGAAIIAAPPYACAKANIASATACMTLPSYVVTADLTLTTYALEKIGMIDETKNLVNDSVWIFSGSKDTVVYPAIVRKLEDYYKNFVERDNIKSKYDIPAAHSLATNNSLDNDCDYLGEPFINYCGFDSVKDFLHHILFTPNKIEARAPASVMKRENLIQFDQRPYVPSSVLLPYLQGIHDHGMIYVPDACKNGTNKCHLHVSLHGCLQNAEFIGNTYFERTGLNEWAETNNIIVLYPQSHTVLPYSAMACWDWFGYTGPFYATKSGIQTRTVRNMVVALLGK